MRVSQGSTPTRIIVNGRRIDVDDPPDTPLLWVLRDSLGLTGTKFGCGVGVCGACTVHADAQAIRSCVTPLAAVADQRITTIEGLARSPIWQGLRGAWIAEDVPQCGYCQVGQLMQAAQLLADKPNPSDADIDAAMAGNLCRCGTYQRIRGAIHRAAAERR